MSTIDVSRQVAELEAVLRSQVPSMRRREALAVLERWQWDEMVDRDSRLRARQLVREFGRIVGRDLGFWGAPSLRSLTARPVLRKTRDNVVTVRQSPALPPHLRGNS